MSKISLWGLLLGGLVGCVWGLSAAAEGFTPIPVARIQDRVITNRDLIFHAKGDPQLMAQFTLPGGANRVRDDLVLTRVLLLEGRERGWIDPAAGGSDPFKDRMLVLHQLAAACEEPDESDGRAWYRTHPEQFSTPLLLRIGRIGVKNDPQGKGRKRLAALRKELEAGQRGFAAAARELAEDPVDKARGGDLGYVAYDASNPAMKALHEAPVGSLYGPDGSGPMVYLFKLTGRREPIAESLSPQVLLRARQAAWRDCGQQAQKAVFEGLKKKWQVEYLVKDVSQALQAQGRKIGEQNFHKNKQGE